MLFGEHHSSSLSARQSSRVLCGSCNPPASSGKREGSFTLCAASTYSMKRRCLFLMWHDFFGGNSWCPTAELWSWGTAARQGMV